jgi:hypothetical protein
MRVAVICVAYLNDAAGVELLSRYFSDFGDLYLHVDAKADASHYRERKYASELVHMPRREIYWGGFNLVRVIIDGLTLARQRRAYDRFMVVTEDTIPTVARSQMIEALTSPTEFFDTRPVNEASVEIAARYRDFYYLDSAATLPKITKLSDRQLTPKMILDINRAERAMSRGKKPVPTLRHGSGWWCLSSEAVDKVLDSYARDEWLRDSFEFSALPEEQYFHTLLGPLPDSHALVYTDWSRQPKPYRFMSLDEVKTARVGRALMLRKVPLSEPNIAQYVFELANS